MENPLFAKEGEDAYNQKGNQNEKEKTFLIHLRFRIFQTSFLTAVGKVDS